MVEHLLGLRGAPVLEWENQTVLNSWVFLLERLTLSHLCVHGSGRGANVIPRSPSVFYFGFFCFSIWRQGLSLGLELAD